MRPPLFGQALGNKGISTLVNAAGQAGCLTDAGTVGDRRQARECALMRARTTRRMRYTIHGRHFVSLYPVKNSSNIAMAVKQTVTNRPWSCVRRSTLAAGLRLWRDPAGPKRAVRHPCSPQASPSQLPEIGMPIGRQGRLHRCAGPDGKRDVIESLGGVRGQRRMKRPSDRKGSAAMNLSKCGK